ncbi:MAG TPA: hypothetical protein VN615_12210 [Gaiellales bacterium]|nr:hypothetical protein [Gaiellales bacterium]
MSAVPHISLAPAPAANVVSLAEWREARRAPVEAADVPSPAPLRLLRLVVDGDEPPPFSLDVFLRRARAVMGDPADERSFDPFRDAEPA